MVYTAAIIGCGKIGSGFSDDPKVKDINTHAAAYVSCPETELIAVCDTNAEKMMQCKNRWNVRTGYTDYQKMIIETRPDIVSVCTPDPTHFEIISKIIKLDIVKLIFAEKPISLQIKEAMALVKNAKKAGIILEVNYSRRYSKKINEIRNLLKQGSIGSIQTVNGYYTKGTLHNGTHWFDLARFLVGEIVKVRGFDTQKERSHDPTYDTFLEFDAGATGFLHACDATQYSIFEMDIVGTNGRIYIKDSGVIIEIFRVVDSPHFSGYKSLDLKETYTDVMRDTLLQAIEDLPNCLRYGKNPVCSGTDGVAALRIALAVCRSASFGRICKIGH